MTTHATDTSDHDDEDRGAQMDTIERKLNQGSQHRRSILAAFANADESELNTSILRERADVPTGSANHHLVTMEEWGLIEDTGEREYPAGGGRPARIWRLTEFAESLSRRLTRRSVRRQLPRQRRGLVLSRIGLKQSRISWTTKRKSRRRSSCWRRKAMQ